MTTRGSECTSAVAQRSLHSRLKCEEPPTSDWICCNTKHVFFAFVSASTIKIRTGVREDPPSIASYPYLTRAAGPRRTRFAKPEKNQVPILAFSFVVENLSKHTHPFVSGPIPAGIEGLVDCAASERLAALRYSLRDGSGALV